MIIDNMDPHSGKKTKDSIIAPKSVAKGLSGMPMDIVFEIFEYLDPLDLLRLARTTKALRSILMSRSSLALWKRVRRAYHPFVDISVLMMPDCPEGMSEPQYASLAFDLICDGCGISDSESSVQTAWNAQLKSCNKCESSLLANESNLENLDLFQILPSWLIVVLKEGNFNRHSRHPSTLNCYYSLKQAQIWSQEYSSLSGSSGNLKEWQCRIVEKHALTIKHIELMYFWKLEMSAERQLQIEGINKVLLIKLYELGWGEELGEMNSWEIHEMCSKFSMDCKPGYFEFPKVWSSNGPTVLRNLKAIQTGRIEKKRQMLISSRCVVLQEICNKYIRGLPDDALIPTIADIALSPLINPIITDERTDFKVTRQTFEDLNLMQILPSIFSDWKIRLDHELVRMVQVELSEPFTKDQLLLATTVFYCDACHIDLFYPGVLVHECSITFEPEENPLQSPAWNSSGNIKFNRDAHQAAIDIINILGLNPKVVTSEDMNKRKFVLQCLSCSPTSSCLGRMTMFWSRAIDHSREQHECRPSMVSWKVPGDEGQLTLQARLVELGISCDNSERQRFKFECGVCGGGEETLGRLKQHLTWAHEVPSPSERFVHSLPDEIVLPETD